MKTVDELADEYAHTLDAYEGSAEEVGHPEGQPIVETYPQLRQVIAGALVEQRRQVDGALRCLGGVPGVRSFPLVTVDALLDCAAGAHRGVGGACDRNEG